MRSALQVAVLLAYPAVIYLVLERGGARVAAGGVAALVLARIVLAPGRLLRSLPAGARWGAGGALALCALSALLQSPQLLLVLPTLMSALGLAVFGGSLRSTPLVERLARLQTETLSTEEVRYCRTVTIVWCGFFALNGAIALALALHGPLSLWALYSGLLSYLAIGAIFAIELLVRRIRFGRRAATPLDAFVRRVWPARLR